MEGGSGSGGYFFIGFRIDVSAPTTENTKRKKTEEKKN